MRPRNTIPTQPRVVILLFLGFLSLSACSLEADMFSDDLSNSTFEQNGPKVADGYAELVVTVRVENKRADIRKYVPQFTPDIQVPSVQGLVFVGCSATNSEGLSFCRFKSRVSGKWEISFSNLTQSREKKLQIEFMDTPSKLISQSSGGTLREATSDGGTLTSSVGGLSSSAKNVDSTVYSHIHGLALEDL